MAILIILVGCVNAQGDWNVYCTTDSECCAVAKQASGDYVVPALKTPVDWDTAWNWMNTHGYGSYGGCLPSAAKVAVWNIYCDGAMKDCVVAREPTSDHPIPVLKDPVDWDTAWNEMENRGTTDETLAKPLGAGIGKWNQHEYEAVYTPDGISWDEARAAAEAKGGHLVIITSEAENQFVYSLVEDDKFWIWDGYDGEGPWLGGYQRQGSTESTGDWSWIDGESFSRYTNWGIGEPNNAGGYENSLEFIGKGVNKGDEWNDRDGSIGKTGYIVEWDLPGQVTTEMEPETSHSSDASETASAEDTPEYWSEAGDKFLENKNYKKANECYNNALLLDPNNAGIWNDKGSALYKSGYEKEAVECLLKSVEINPSNAVAWFNLGWIFSHHNKNGPAIKAYSLAAAIKSADPYSPGYYLICKIIADIYRDDRDYHKATKFYEEITRLHRRDDKAWLDLSESLNNEKKYEDALGAANAAVDLNPSNRDAWIQKISLLKYLGLANEADAASAKAKKQGFDLEKIFD